MELLLIVILGYVIGAIPFALVVGKLFYHTDIRNHGSGNLGGGNTGRVLGPKAGLAVMALDLLKVSLVIFLAELLSSHSWAIAVGAVSAGIGHCYPVFAGFKGGKAVAAMYGFFFGLWIVGGFSPLVFFLPLCVFLLVLYIGKIIALASSVSAIGATVYILLIRAPYPIATAMGVFTLLILVRHRENFRRMIKGTENKIHWM